MSWAEVEKARLDFAEMLDGLFHLEYSDNVLAELVDQTVYGNTTVELVAMYDGIVKCFCETQNVYPEKYHSFRCDVYVNGVFAQSIHGAGTFARNACCAQNVKAGDTVKMRFVNTTSNVMASTIEVTHAYIGATVVFGKEGIVHE